jgi:hypothetical protein
VWAGVAALGLISSTCPAQRPPEERPSGQPELRSENAQIIGAEPEPTDLTAPDGARALAALEAVRSWLKEGRIPAEAPPDVPSAKGAVVWLWYLGSPAGRGEAWMLGGSPSPRPVVWLAADEAWREALVRLEASGVTDPADLARVGGSMAVSVELAGRPVPMRPETFAEVDATVGPGAEGVAARAGDRFEAVFPTAMWGAGADVPPSWALSGAAGRALDEPGVALPGDPRGEPAALSRSRGVVWYRFGVTHAAAPGGGPATLLVRGVRLVPESAVSGAAVRRAAGDLARTLVDRVTGSAAAKTDDGRWLAAWALARYAGVAGDEGQAAACASAAAGILAERGEERGPAASQFDRLTREALAVLPERVRPALVAPDDGGDDAGPAPALAALADPDAARARAALDAVLAGSTPAALVTHLPWVVLAERRLAGPAGTIGSAPALREMRELVYRHTLTRLDAGPGGEDLVGGVIFTTGGVRLPSWTTARAAAGLAAMITDDRLTDAGERPRELARLVPLLRFLLQLQRADFEACTAGGPDSGGVRAAAWSSQRPIEASAMTLAAYTDTILAMDAMAPGR